MRVKIQEPAKYSFKTQLIVRVSDLNYANHLSNDKILTYVHQARVEFFESLGFSEIDFAGVGTIMADAAIVFKSEGYLNDSLIIEVGVADVGHSSFDLIYKISKEDKGNLLALVKTAIVCFDYSNKKVCPIPNPVLLTFQQMV
jgi:YbgC/YbaW family acyl-CoA thioester hydrolase